MSSYPEASIAKLLNIYRIVPLEEIEQLTPDEYLELLKDPRDFTTPKMKEIIEKYLMED